MKEDIVVFNLVSIERERLNLEVEFFSLGIGVNLQNFLVSFLKAEIVDKNVFDRIVAPNIVVKIYKLWNITNCGLYWIIWK